MTYVRYEKIIIYYYTRKDKFFEKKVMLKDLTSGFKYTSIRQEYRIELYIINISCQETKSNKIYCSR